MTTTISSREFNHDLGSAKKAARTGPVFITDRGKPSHVLLSYKEYARIATEQCSVVDALSMRGLSDIEFDPVTAKITAKDADLS